MIELHILALAALLAGSYTDIRVREIPDWISFSLIGAALGIRLLSSIITGAWSIFGEGVLGFLIYVVIALLMFYSKQWGGRRDLCSGW